MVRRRTLAAALAALAALALPACTDGGEPPAAAADACVPAAEGGPTAKDVLAGLEGSLAFVDTPFGTGSAVLIEDGHVVTNLHVIDPARTVSLTFEGGDVHDDVAVVGVDAMADIAVLGPVEVDARPVTLADHDHLERGEDLYLVGYPGEVDEAPEPTISRGILSRLREVEVFDHTYLQTDAAIGGGQSGGALVDRAGCLVGISGLGGFAESFALGLSAADVRTAVDGILAGGGTEYRPYPGDEGVTAGTVSAPDDGEAQLVRETGPRPEVLRLEVPEGTGVEVSDYFGEPLLVNQAMLDRWREEEAALGEAGFDLDELDLVADEPAAPGVWEVELPRNSHVHVLLAPAPGAGPEIAFTSSAPLVPYVDDDDDRRIEPGNQVRGVIDGLELRDRFLVDLEEGDEVELRVHSVGADFDVEIWPQDGSRADGLWADDGEGLYGLDPAATYEVPASGTYVVQITEYSGLASGYVLQLTR